MKLIINTASTYKGGGVQVARSFIEECKKFTENEYHIILGNMVGNLINEGEFPSNFRFYRIGFRPATRVFSFLSHDGYFKKLEKKIQPDVVFTTSGPAYWRPNVSHLTGFNLGHYIYRDSIFYKNISLWKRLKWDVKGMVIKYFFKKDTDEYVVQTDDVNVRLKKWLGTDHVHTVSNTCSQYYYNPIKFKNKLPERTMSEFRLLTLSAWHTHKNIDIIPHIIDCLPDKLKKTIRFVVTLPEKTFQKFIASQHRGLILNVGPVKPKEGPSLYKECDALFLPTLLECFSASYPEAMAMEKPIITTDLGFARSICGNAALFFEPTDPKSASNKILQLYHNEDLQKELIMAGKKQLKNFDSPKKRAIKYLNLCKKLVDEGKN